MSRDLGQDVPDLEKLYARKLWADFSHPICSDSDLGMRCIPSLCFKHSGLHEMLAPEHSNREISCKLRLLDRLGANRADSSVSIRRPFFLLFFEILRLSPIFLIFPTCLAKASALYRGQNPQNREKRVSGSKSSHFPSPQKRAL